MMRAYVMQRNTVPGTTYLFIVPGFKDNPSMVGYMPLKSNYGFLTPQATTRDAAHELGHGVFNLRHTFSTNNMVNLPEGSTQNLMDYSAGTELFKYQWDFIHNPEGGWFVWEDVEEGAMISRMIFDEKTNIGGLPQIIDYILSKKYDDFKLLFLEFCETVDYNISILPYDYLLYKLFNNKIQIDIAEEAEAIVTMAYQYMVKREIAVKQDDIVSYLDKAEEWSEIEIAENILITLKEFAKNKFVIDEIKELVDSYFSAKNELFSSNSVSLQKNFIYGIESNQKFKKIIRDVIGVKDNKRMMEIMDIKRAINNGEHIKIKEIEDFFSNNPNMSSQLKKQISDNIELDKLVNRNLHNQRNAINAALKSKKFFNIASKAFVLFDVSSALLQASEGNLSPVTILAFSPTYGLLAIVFNMEVNRLQGDIETFIFENMRTWSEVTNWKKSKTCKYFGNADLLLQYAEEKDKYNHTTPTSIRILDRELAKEIFGFYPSYVNYDFYQGERNYAPRYYVPYINK